MTHHAPGPWETDRAARGGIEVCTRQGAMVCKVTQWRGPLGQTITEANAALIAAAPDMLAALQMHDALPAWPDREALINAMDATRAAIAKALNTKAKEA